MRDSVSFPPKDRKKKERKKYSAKRERSRDLTGRKRRSKHSRNVERKRKRNRFIPNTRTILKKDTYLGKASFTVITVRTDSGSKTVRTNILRVRKTTAKTRPLSHVIVLNMIKE